jgi:hypothetical protein
MAAYRTISIRELKPGSMLKTPAFDEHLVKLLDAETVVDSRLIDRLQERGITEVVVECTAKKTSNQGKKIVPAETQAMSVGTLGGGRLVEECGACGRRISLQPPKHDSAAIIWRCDTCDAIYFGSDVVQADSHGLHRDASVGFDTLTTAIRLNVEARNSPPENIQRIVRSMASQEQHGAERRRHKRYPVMAPVAAMPVAADFRLSGEPVQMTTANVSLGGAALIHTRFLDAPYLALDFALAGMDRLQVVFRVLRVQSRGVVYEIGGEFISRLSGAPLRADFV